jgi:hypothetical protein
MAVYRCFQGVVEANGHDEAKKKKRRNQVINDSELRSEKANDVGEY